MNGPSVDLSLPLATVLREGTRDAHDKAEQSPAASWLSGGELDKEEYVRYLMILWHIYDALETGLERNSSYPTIQPTYNPAILARSPALAADISFFLQVPESTWQSHPIHLELINSPPKSLSDCTSRLKELSDLSDPSLLVAHAYVRYLGDLSGGQQIRRNLGKAYRLNNDGAGLSFYDFKELGGTKSAGLPEMRVIKAWFREGLNRSALDDRKLKASLLKEANLAFQLTTAIFDDLQAPAGLSVTSPAASLIESSSEKKTTAGSKEIPVVVSQNTGTSLDTQYPMATIISVIMAVCLAHFLLVTFGFTGARGGAKLESVETWIESLFAGTP